MKSNNVTWVSYAAVKINTMELSLTKAITIIHNYLIFQHIYASFVWTSWILSSHKPIYNTINSATLVAIQGVVVEIMNNIMCVCIYI